MKGDLPSFILNVCWICALTAIFISCGCIVLHLLNYRKPLQQRLIVRIIIIIPIYAVVCYMNLVSSELLISLVEPIKEIYEAFVLYMFYCLLTDLLGGERNIIVMTSGRAPVTQPGFPMRFIGQKVDISDPQSFLAIKRCILQYVWLKPVICLLFALGPLFENKHATSFLFSYWFWVNLGYNISVSLSLFNLALFWKCLYDDLKKFKPWGKFLCVKLIIFASYWQGIILSIMTYYNIIQESSTEIQNILLCIELIFFAIGHWVSFSYKDYTIQSVGNVGRMSFWYALSDVFGAGDLIMDFKITFHQGEQQYNFKKFQSVDNDTNISILDGVTRMKKLNQGMRYYNDGGKRGTYWLEPERETLNLQEALVDDENQPGTSKKPQRIPQDEVKVNRNPKINKNVRAQMAHERKINTIKKHTKELYKLDNASTENLLSDIGSSKEEFLGDNRDYIRAIRERPFGDENYPIIYDEFGYLYSRDLKARRKQAHQRKFDEESQSFNNVGSSIYGAIN